MIFVVVVVADAIPCVKIGLRIGAVCRRRRC